MTFYWRLARAVRRCIPHNWIREWSMDYIESMKLKLISPQLDVTIVPHKQVSIVLNGTRLDLKSGDVVNVEIADPPPPPVLVPVADMVLH